MMPSDVDSWNARSTPLGMYFSAFEHRGRFREILNNWPSRNVQIIVVSEYCALPLLV